MNWENKSRMFRLLSAMPFGHRAHYFLQRRVTKEWPRKRQDLAAFALRAQHFLDLFRAHSKTDTRTCEFVEIGAGRDLALAIALRMLGLQRIVCIDIERLAKIDLVQHAFDFMAAQFGHRRFEIRDWSRLEAWGICYLAPQDARRSGLPQNSTAGVISSEVLEHVPTRDLAQLFSEAKRILTVDGLMIHAIDYSDHYARSDHSITRFNFLKFDDAEWRQHNSALQYVNRLRHSEYEILIRNAGFEIVHADVDRQPATPEVVANLAPRFSPYIVGDLFALRSIVVAKVASC